MHTYHISFLGKKAISHTFRAHPLQWKPYSGILFLSEVSTSIHTFRKSKVSNFYGEVNVNPANGSMEVSHPESGCMHIICYLHAVSCSKISVHNSFASKVLHSHSNLQAHVHQFLLNSLHLKLDVKVSN